METEKGIVFVPIEAALINTTGLTSQDMRVFGAIKLHRNHKTKQCNPSIKTVSKETSMSESGVKRCRRNLKEKGLLVWKQNGPNKSCDYTFPLLDASPEVQQNTLEALRGTRDAKKWEQQTMYVRGSGVTPQRSTGEGGGSQVNPLGGHPRTPGGVHPRPPNHIKRTTLTTTTTKKMGGGGDSLIQPSEDDLKYIDRKVEYTKKRGLLRSTPTAYRIGLIKKCRAGKLDKSDFKELVEDDSWEHLNN